MSIAAGLLLVVLGIREYRHGHSHGGEAGHDHGHGEGHDHHDHGHDHDASSPLARLKRTLPFGGHGHTIHGDPAAAADRGPLGIVGLTLLLIAGYRHYEERVERYAPYLPLFSAAVLVTMGVGFVLGLF